MTTDTIDTAAPPDPIDLDPPVEQPAMGAEDARTITKQIHEAAEGLWDLIARAYTEKVWLALSYASWATYCRGEFPDGLPSLPRDTRKEVARTLKDAGMSVRQIAAVTDTAKSTISDDLQVSGNRTPKQRKQQPKGQSSKPRRTTVEKAVENLQEETNRLAILSMNDCEHKAELARNVEALSKCRDLLDTVITKQFVSKSS